MPVNIHGKDYLTVAERISTFRQEHKDWGIDTDLVSHGELVVIKAVIKDEQGRQVGSGYAEELRGSTNINTTSALENCETSAIGRALASCGYGGEQYASANEVTDAIINQKVIEVTKKLIAHNKAVSDNIESIAYIKKELLANNLESAVEAMHELDEETRIALNLAPTKGGIWSIEEKRIFMSDEYAEARTAYFNNT